MTPTGEIQDHQARCLPHLLRLRLMARSETGTVPTGAVTEVAEAVGAILAEAEAAGRVVSATAVDSRGSTVLFLQVRLNRLEVAGDDAIAAARAGNLAEMRRHLHRFDALTSAIWAVQQAVYGQGAARYSGNRPLSGRPSSLAPLRSALQTLDPASARRGSASVQGHGQEQGPAKESRQQTVRRYTG